MNTDFLGPVGVIGTGSFGLAVTKLLSYNCDVRLYGRNERVIEQLSTLSHELSTYLPRLKVTDDIKRICEDCKVLIPSIPSTNFRALMRDMSSYLSPSHIIIHTIKGLTPSPKDKYQINTMSNVIMQESNVLRIGYLSGPNLAVEIMQGQPAAALISSRYEEVLNIGKALFESEAFMIDVSTDILGAEVSGALKNIVALGTGMIDGLGWGKNTQAHFITKAWHEMMYIAQQLNQSKPLSLIGLAGIGDLIATATSEKSRNFSFGQRLVHHGHEVPLDFTHDELAEGVSTTRIVHESLQKRQLEAPLVETIYNIIFNHEDPEVQLKKFLHKPAISLLKLFTNES